MAISDAALAADLAAVANIPSVPTVLRILSQVTGMRFSAIARVTPQRWIVCSAFDSVPYGLGPGSELPIETTFCDSIQQGGPPVLFDQASTHPVYSQHPSPRRYGLESYASFPIRLSDGTFFGTLCALDPEPRKVDTPETREMFAMFATMIGQNLSLSSRLEATHLTLREERTNAALREQFIAVLGHDLRNPLGAISASSSLLARKPNDAQAIRLIQIIDGSVHRMSALIDDVTDFARGRLGGGIQLELDGEVALDETLQQVVGELRVSSPQRAIEAMIQLAPARFRCDPKRIGQLASNLLSNALIHGAQDGPVEFSASVEGEAFVLSVANAGERIPREVLARIFQPFERAARHRDIPGLGLGLYIAHSIAVAHGGTLEALSDPCQTRFTFRMPGSR